MGTPSLKMELQSCGLLITEQYEADISCVLVGDRIYTDMACAENAGVEGILVLSGEATRKNALDCGLQIPYVFESVYELYQYLEGKV